MNEIVSERIAICKAERMPYLDLGHLELSEIPTEVGSLVWLERLSLSGNHISDLSSLASLTKIHKLSLSNNKISDLSALESFERLKFLFIQNNTISDITVLSQISPLKKIVAHHNHIQKVPNNSSGGTICYMI